MQSLPQTSQGRVLQNVESVTFFGGPGLSEHPPKAHVLGAQAQALLHFGFVSPAWMGR